MDPTVCFSPRPTNVVYHREMCPPIETLQEEVVIWSSVRLGCLVIVQHQYQQQSASSARQAWGDPRVLDAACVKTRGVLAQRPPSSLHPRHPPSDRAAGVSLSSPRLVSSLRDYLPSSATPASLAWIGARLPGCEASPKHGDLREPAHGLLLLHHGQWHNVAWTRGTQIRDCML